MKVDLTAYVEKHDFVFDAVLDEQFSNDEVTFFIIKNCWFCTLNVLLDCDNIQPHHSFHSLLVIYRFIE